MRHQCLYCGEDHLPEDTCVTLPKAIVREGMLASPIVVVSNPFEDTISDFDENAAKAAALMREANRQDIPNDESYNKRFPTLLGVGSQQRAPTAQDPSNQTAGPSNHRGSKEGSERTSESDGSSPPSETAGSSSMRSSRGHLEGIDRNEGSEAHATPSGTTGSSSMLGSSGTLADINESTIGSYIGDYELVAFLGEGGMGRVYRARHIKDGSEVAIKILKPEIAQFDEPVRRFFREAQVVDGVQHPNIIDIVDLGRTRYGEYFLLMELLEGEPLRVALEKGAPFSSERIVHITRQLCSALQACHQKGVAHRDLKSDNIFLITRRGQRDFVKVLDFGLAKLYKGNAGIDAAPMVSAPGVVLGTPICMSPEQALGEEIDQQTDIYALGVLLYQMATGHLPFFDPNPIVLLKLHLTTQPIRPSKHVPSIDKSFESVILRCLEKEKERRYRSAEEVSRAISAALPGDEAPISQKKPISNAALFSLAAATFVAALLLTWLFNFLMS